MESREGFGSELPHSRQRRERNSVGWVTARAKRVLQCSSEGASGGVRYPSEPAVGVCAGSLFPPNVSLLRTSLLAPPKRIKFCVSRELATPCAAHLLARLSLSLRNSGQVRCAVSRPIAGTRRGSHREILVAYERPVLICVGVRNGSRVACRLRKLTDAKLPFRSSLPSSGATPSKAAAGHSLVLLNVLIGCRADHRG
jgi:hypothetical protein